LLKVTTKITSAINKSQGQVIGDVNFGKVYQVKLTYSSDKYYNINVVNQIN